MECINFYIGSYVDLSIMVRLIFPHSDVKTLVVSESTIHTESFPQCVSLHIQAGEGMAAMIFPFSILKWKVNAKAFVMSRGRALVVRVTELLRGLQIVVQKVRATRNPMQLCRKSGGSSWR